MRSLTTIHCARNSTAGRKRGVAKGWSRSTCPSRCRYWRKSGSAWILINYYRDNPYCHQWGSLLTVQTHLLSADEWSGLFRDAGFKNVAHERIVDRSPSPDVYTGRWFRDAEQLRAFKAEGALLIYAAKK